MAMMIAPTLLPRHGAYYTCLRLDLGVVNLGITVR
jgi:hypothetical protein